VRLVLADTFYWIAMTDPRDSWHGRALAASHSLGTVRIVTTEPILIELLNFFAAAGPRWRREALATVESIRQSQSVDVLPYLDTPLDDGLALYAARDDKAYSMTDCISMQWMRSAGVYEVLTHDEHFAQEGFVLLLR
jgi:predicted nucleic acid-binding protein